MMRHPALLLFCLLGLRASGADATVIFDRPAADPFTAGTFFTDVSRPREASTPFQLDDAADVQGIAWRGGYFDPATPGATAAFVIHFFDDVAGTPSDTPFYSADVLADVAAVPGVVVEFAYTAVLSQALRLPGGVTLWISIAENDDATNATFMWRKSSESGTSFSRVDAASDWQPFPGSAAFTLDGIPAAVPEPNTTALLGMGILGLAGVRAHSPPQRPGRRGVAFCLSECGAGSARSARRRSRTHRPHRAPHRGRIRTRTPAGS